MVTYFKFLNSNPVNPKPGGPTWWKGLRIQGLIGWKVWADVFRAWDFRNVEKVVQIRSVQIDGIVKHSTTVEGLASTRPQKGHVLVDLYLFPK